MRRDTFISNRSLIWREDEKFRWTILAIAKYYELYFKITDKKVDVNKRKRQHLDTFHEPNLCKNAISLLSISITLSCRNKKLLALSPHQTCHIVARNGKDRFFPRIKFWSIIYISNNQRSMNEFLMAFCVQLWPIENGY